MWQYFRLQHTVFYSDLSRAQNMVWVKIEGKIISKHEPLWLLIEMICRETKITLSYGEVQVTEGNKKYCKCMKETQGKLTLIQVSARLESSGVNLVVAPDLQMRWGSSRPWDKRGPSLKTKIFRPFGPQFGLIIRGVHGPSPGSATATVLYSRKQVEYSLWHRRKFPAG